MAKMYPETYPGDLHVDDPEYQVFQILKELPETYSVIYSKKFKGGRDCKEEVEIDFLIFDGSKNLTCLEVKGGEIVYSGGECCWYQNGKRMKRSPDRQASVACHAVIDYLGPDGRQVNINWALAFPNCTRPAGSSRISEVPDDLVLDASALLDPTEALNRIAQYNEAHLSREGVRRHQASRILERLLRSVGFVTKIGVRLLHDAKQLIQATEQQLEVLEDLALNPRTAVMGYAGTGKTIIATEFAKRCAEQGQKVLLVFYNRMVANTVRYGLGRDSSVECMTFHSLARREIEAVDQDWWKENKGKDDPEFWEMTVPLKMLESLDVKQPEYDVVIVDEGQDFKADWFETLSRLQKQGEDSRFVILYDANQDIFGRWEDLPWAEGTYTRKQLRKNCRNTKEIVKHLNSIIPSEMVGFEKSPAGQPVLFKESSSPKEEAEMIKNDLASFLKEGVAPGEIVILINEPLADSAVSSIQKIGRYPVEWMGRTYRPDSSKIQVTDIRNFKGLEANVLLITGLGKRYSKEAPELLYTQASRACLLLTIYYSASEDS
ncbi:NERD domain-containing protein/DEAD/DEAH box helicase [Akkermansiaceae bacterium]|nr:NERD domain-containing protein/DEAD/DEAH box helicase [Akkermansiaceae bacterium]